MKTIIGNFWNIQADFRGIPTNGDVNIKGHAVMGVGIALQARQRFPGIEKALGRSLMSFGTMLVFLGIGSLFAFPVKHHWWEKADKALIAKSVHELTEIVTSYPDKIFALPLVGTGAGGLQSEDVWPLLQELPDNVVVVVQKPEMLPNL